MRYEGTGKALRTYADALRTAQNWLDLHLDEVERAEREYQSALDEKEAADRNRASVDHQWPWEDEPTQADKEAASGAVDAANTSLTGAKADRDAQWRSFDHVFEAWSDAYDDAVEGVQKAMDTADNGDGFWGFVDDLLTVISVVLIILTIVALIIGAPFTGLLAGVLLGLTLLSLGLTALKYVDGRATLGDAVPVAHGTDPFDVESAQAGSLRQPVADDRQRRPRGAADAAIPHDDAQLAVGDESCRAAVHRGDRVALPLQPGIAAERGELARIHESERLWVDHGALVTAYA